MKHGSVYQRHLHSCPRNADGSFRPHRCRGPWAYTIDHGRALDGRRKQITRSGYPTRAAAMAAVKQMSDLLMADVGAHGMTVGEYLDTWLAGKQALKPSTRAHYRDLIRLYLKPQIGSLLLLDLRAHHLDRLYLSIADGVRGRPLSNGSIRRVHACLRSALNTAVKRRLIPYNPALHVELPTENAKRPEPWTAEQCRTFLACIRDDDLAPLYHLLLVTGLRRGEAVGLRWRDLDLDHGNLRVVQQITEVGGRPTLGTPKSRSGSRVVPLDLRTVKILRKHQGAQEQRQAEWGDAWQPADLVFTKADGTPLRPEYVTRHFQALAAEHGLPVIRLHDLRHTNATLALEAGIDVKIVSERLGHSTTGITQDIYTHVAPRIGRDAADRIAALIAVPDEPAEALGETDASAMPAQAPDDDLPEVPE